MDVPREVTRCSGGGHECFSKRVREGFWGTLQALPGEVTRCYRGGYGDAVCAGRSRGVVEEVAGCSGVGNEVLLRRSMDIPREVNICSGRGQRCVPKEVTWVFPRQDHVCGVGEVMWVCQRSHGIAEEVM